MTFIRFPQAHKIFWTSLFILISFSIPSAFAKRGITIDDLSAIRDIKTISLSPDGKYVAFQVIQGHKDTNDFTVNWYVAATKPGAKPIKIASGTKPVLDRLGQHLGSQIVWFPDSEGVYFIKKQDDGMVQIWRSSHKHLKPRQVTHNAGNVQSLQISPDGSKIFFTVSRPPVEIKNLKQTLSEQGFLQQEPLLYSVESGVILPLYTDGRKHWSFQNQTYNCRLTNWVYDMKSGVERKATKVERDSLHNQKDNVSIINRQGFRRDETTQIKKMSPDGKRLAWIENEDPETYKGSRPPMTLKISQNGNAIICPAKECTKQKGIGFKGLWWHPNGKEVIFHVIDGPHNSLTSFYGWIPGKAEVRTILRTDDYVGPYTGPCDLVGKRLVCGWETWTSPAKIVSIDIEDGELSTIVDINPEFKKLSFTKIEKVLGEDDYGHRVYAHLIYPKGYKKGQKYPLVITSYHSYGFLRGATGNDQPIHAYAQQGIAVLSFDHRVHYTEIAKKLSSDKYSVQNLKNLYLKQGPNTAIEKMVSVLVMRGIVDPDRVGITGFSHGETILGTALVRKNYAAASSSGFGTFSPYPRFSPLHPIGKAINEALGKITSAKGQTARRKVSVIANANKIDTPILLQVADREFRYIEVGYNMLLNAGKPVEMYVYPDEHHVKWQPAHKYKVYSRNLDWFNFWLMGIEDNAPGKIGQYNRWRKLRDVHYVNLIASEKKKNEIAYLKNKK